MTAMYLRTLPSRGVGLTNDRPGAAKSEPADPVDLDSVAQLFHTVCDTAAELLAANDDWSMSGARPSQYAIDVTIDDACTSTLHAAGLATLSEESGITGPGPGDRSAIVVIDPLDGSTNASLGLPWCATSLCLVVDGVPTVAAVRNLRTGQHFAAVRGGGSTLDGRPLHVGAPTRSRDAVVAINARPPDRFRPRQFRAMGSTALDIAAVATGRSFDAYADFDGAVGVWDYLGALLVLEEAGGVAADADGRDLITLDPDERRRPIVASSPALLAELLDAA